MFPFLFFLLAAVVALVAPAQGAAVPTPPSHPDLYVSIDATPTVGRPVQVTLHRRTAAAPVFHTGAVVSLSTTASCTSAISTTAVWTAHDTSADGALWTATLQPTSLGLWAATPRAVVCYARSNKTARALVKRSRGGIYFAIFAVEPTAAVLPEIVFANVWARLTVTGLPGSAVLAATTSPEGCESPWPFGVIHAANATRAGTPILFPAGGVDVYLCASADSGRTWTQLRGQFLPFRVHTHSPPLGWSVLCAPLIAGVESRCVVTALGGVPFLASEVSVAVLRDGNGEDVCQPAPTRLRQSPARTDQATFMFLPSHMGRAAAVRLVLRGTMPCRVPDGYHTKLFYTLPNNQTDDLIDWSLVRLIVQAPPVGLTTSLTPTAETHALRHMYAGLSGPSWRAKTRWMSGDPCTNNWAGVACRLGHVVRITLPNNALAGRVPEGASGLRYLESLDLSDNAITGFDVNVTFPLLRSLRMARNAMTTAPNLGASRCLTHLVMSHNSLTAFPRGSKSLPALSFLDLSRNAISEAVPSFGNTSALRVLRLSHNRLRGPLPATLSRHTHLVEIDFSHNAINSTIPMGYASLCGLQILQLQYNWLKGNVLPRAAACASFVGTLNWDVSYNHLTFLPPHALVEDAKYVNLEGNNFLCPTPTAWRLPHSARLVCDAKNV